MKESYIMIKTTFENAKKMYGEIFDISDTVFDIEQSTLKICDSDIYLYVKDDYIIFNDFSGGENWFGLVTKTWLEMSANYELIYAHYDDSSCTAEFVRILNGKCVREFSVYDGKSDVDYSDSYDEFQFKDWTSVAEYVEKLGYGLTHIK